MTAPRVIVAVFASIGFLGVLGILWIIAVITRPIDSDFRKRAEKRRPFTL